MRIIDFDPLQVRRNGNAIRPGIKARSEIEHRIHAVLQRRCYEVVDDDGMQGDGPDAEEPFWQFRDDLLPTPASEGAQADTEGVHQLAMPRLTRISSSPLATQSVANKMRTCFLEISSRSRFARAGRRWLPN